MRGPKRNEGATVVGERAGTSATAKHVRSSAYKARVVLDVIRGLDVRSADQVLQFTDRGIARDIRKVLASAVANATDTESGAYIADADELYIIACFADEGPTLRRFKPRARGRATRIRKRTCHIKIIVARMSDDRIAHIEARAERAGQSGAASRSARVERSRQRAQEAKAKVDEADAVEANEDIDTSEDDGDDAAATPDVQGFADTGDAATESGADDDADAADDAGAADAADDTADDAGADDAATDDAATDDAAASGDGAGDGTYEAGEWAGSVLPDADGNGPESHPIKGNADSMLYHVPGSRYYKVTKAEVWFDTAANAEAAGFAEPGSAKEETESGDDN